MQQNNAAQNFSQSLIYISLSIDQCAFQSQRTRPTRRHAFKWAAVTTCLCYRGDWQIQVCHRWRGKQKDKTSWERKGKHFDNFKDWQMWRACVCVCEHLMCCWFTFVCMCTRMCVSCFLSVRDVPWMRTLRSLRVVTNINRCDRSTEWLLVMCTCVQTYETVA